MRFLGINAVFHDSAAALVVDGQIVAAAEEERFNRRKHAKRPVPFSAWELPEQAAAWCLRQAGLDPGDLDGVGYSYDPGLVDYDVGALDANWEHMRTTYAQRAPRFLATALPGLDPERVAFVRHHVAHAASTGLVAPFGDHATLALDGRGESTSMLAGRYVDDKLDILAAQSLPHSLGLFYEDLTERLGFMRSSDEYKVMALASYGTPRFLDRIRSSVYTTDGGFHTDPIDWDALAPERQPGGEFEQVHADLAASVQRCLEDVVLELCEWLHRQTGYTELSLSGGIALNCVANSRIHRESPFDQVWVQPAAGDAGTALGAALTLAAEAGDRPRRKKFDAALGRGFDADEIAAALDSARVRYEHVDDIGVVVAEALAENKIVAWFQGRSEFGPRALGHRSLLAHPGHVSNLERLNDVKGREQFRPVAPMVLAERASAIFRAGPFPSPYMLFVHEVADEWRERIPATTHVDGTARIQTVEGDEDPDLARMLREFESRTGLPVVVNTSLNTAGRPMVDSPRDALECFGSAPIDLLAIGPYVVRRS
jgi:carbamoyltransferase